MIIAIFGQKENGKTELAHMIRSKLPVNYMIGAFAHPIKHYVCSMTGVTMEYLDEWKNKDEPPPGWTKTVREVLQFVGEGMRQYVSKTMWIDAAMNLRKTIIADGRYQNEAESVKRNNGFNILIVRPDKYVHLPAHPSESWVGDVALSYRATIGPLGNFGNSIDYMSKWLNEYRRLFDFVIWNDGTKEDLDKKADQLVNHLRRERKL